MVATHNTSTIYANKKLEILSKEKQDDLLIKAKNGDIDARNKLIESNIPFVIKIAKQYKNSKIEIEELISEGCFGLYKAIDKFDLHKKNNFLVYAIWWIRYYIIKSIQASTTIRKPVNKIHELNTITRLKNEIKNHKDLHLLSEEEAEKYIAQKINISIPQLKTLLTLKQEVISLDILQNSNSFNSENNAIIDAITDENSINPEDHTIEQEIQHFITCCVASLSQREADIINERYGLLKGKQHSLDELSKKFHLSKERIRQIEITVTQKLKKMLHKADLVPQI